MTAKGIKLETKTIGEREVKLEGWKVKQEVDEPAMYAPYIPMIKHNWSEWIEQFVVIPKKSINGKILWGKVYRRAVMNAWKKVELYKHHPDWKEQWASKKEMFVESLKNG